MSFLTAAFTPSGTNARRSQEKTQGDVSNYAYDLIKRMNPQLESQIDYAGQMEPGRQAALSRAINEMGSGHEAADLESYANTAYSNAARANKALAQQMRGTGASAALQGGQAQAIANDAQRASNNQAAYYASPEYHMKKAQSLLNLYGQAQNPQGLSNFAQLGSMVYGRPEVMVQPGIGSTLGAIAGDWAAGGFK